MLDEKGNTLLHLACRTENITLDIVQVIFNKWPEAMRISSNHGSLPIHTLCHYREDTDHALTVLQYMLNIDPTLVREREFDGCLPIHTAVDNMPIAFCICKVLIDLYPESLTMRARDGELPIHNACGWFGNRDVTDTIQYMLDLYPEIINVRDGCGWLPIHIAAMRGKAKTIELLLKHDPDAAIKLTVDEYHHLPLQLVVRYGDLDTVKVLFDAYPEAIRIFGDGDTPLGTDSKSTITFIRAQQACVQKAKDTLAMHSPDVNGWLPLHHALKDAASLGSIKLLLKGNPSALRVISNIGALPIHIACQFSSSKVVKHLVELDEGRTLYYNDMNKDSPLHYACRGGNLGS